MTELTQTRSTPVVGERVREMFGDIARRYDLANSVLSFGIHHIWRRRLVGMLPPAKDLLALDLCTGTADLVPIVAKRFGNCVGADFCLPMLEQGRDKLKQVEGRAVLVQADAMRLPFHDESFDIVTVSFGVRNFEKLEQGLSEIRRVLKPGGALLVLEFGQPSLPVWRELYKFYSAYLMPFIGGLVTGKRDAYTYLPKTASEFPCRNEFLSVLEKIGFVRNSYKSLTGGIAFAYRAYR